MKFGKITGEQMASADYAFMRNTLGITDENQCSKLKGEIDRVRNGCLEDSAIFGWGNNKHGQLGQKIGQNIFSAPKKIPLPDHITLDETKKNSDSITSAKKSVIIDRIFIGNKYSAFMTDSGEFWACGNCAG